MLSVTRALSTKYRAIWTRDISLKSLSSYRIRFAKFSQNLNRTKLIPHWSAWRRLRRRALSSYPSRDLLLYSARDKLILLSDLFRAKYANDLSDISHPYEYS